MPCRPCKRRSQRRRFCFSSAHSICILACAGNTNFALSEQVCVHFKSPQCCVRVSPGKRHVQVRSAQNEAELHAKSEDRRVQLKIMLLCMCVLIRVQVQPFECCFSAALLECSRRAVCLWLRSKPINDFHYSS
jgi:hypothetical protein